MNYVKAIFATTLAGAVLYGLGAYVTSSEPTGCLDFCPPSRADVASVCAIVGFVVGLMSGVLMMIADAGAKIDRAWPYMAIGAFASSFMYLGVSIIMMMPKLLTLELLACVVMGMALGAVYAACGKGWKALLKF